MSKSQQRNESAFSAGREFYNSITQEDLISIKLSNVKNKESKKINKFVRFFWLKGWGAGVKGIESGKVRKRKIRRKLALLN